MKHQKNFSEGFSRDKTKQDKLVYNPNDDKQKLPDCKIKL